MEHETRQPAPSTARSAMRAAIAAAALAIVAAMTFGWCGVNAAFADEPLSAQVQVQASSTQGYALLDADGQLWQAMPNGDKNATPWLGSSGWNFNVKPEAFSLVNTLFIESDLKALGEVWFEYVESEGSNDTKQSDSRDLRRQLPNLQRVVFKVNAAGTNDIEKIEEDVFYGLDHLSTVEGFENTQTNHMGKNVFRGCTALTSIAFPSTLKIIDNGAFQDCSKLTSVTGFEATKVATLSYDAFNGCRELRAFATPPSLKEVGEDAFSGCINLIDVKLNEGLTEIYSSAFAGCELLPSIVIPSTVNNIKSSAFSGCSMLMKVQVLAATYPVLGYSVFRNTPITIKAYSTTAYIYVPDDKVSAYQGASGWKDYADRIVSDRYLNPVNISAATISVADATYTGKELFPGLVVTYGGQTLVAGQDYEATYSNNVAAGKGTVTLTGVKGFTGTVSTTFTISKASNTMKASAKSKTLTYYRYQLKRSKMNVLNLNVSNAQGKVTYKNVSKGKAAKKVKVNSSGKITIAKGAKKGKYAVKIQVTAAGNANYKKATKKVSFTVRVK